MNEFLMQNEAVIRLSVFLGLFAAMGVWEVLAPRRALVVSKARRWISNLGIVVLNSLLLRWLFPAAAVGMAVLAEARGWGLFNNLVLPGWAATVLAVVVLDFAIYLQHVMFHAVPALWRLHRLHHTDMDFDVTTALRFHPIEIVLSMLIKFAVIVVIGPPVGAVIVFEALLNGMAMFNHSNVRIPQYLDRRLRAIVVTPDMHRVHHSVRPAEANSNFGFSLSWWDHLLGTYVRQPADGHKGMTIGVVGFHDARWSVLPWMLLQPFTKGAKPYAIDRFGSDAK